MSKSLLTWCLTVQAKEFAIVRLNPNDRLSWHLWPVLEERVVRFGQEIAHETPEIMQNIVLQARQRWTAAPALTGYWLVLDEDRRAFSHLIAEVNQRHNVPFVEVIQWEVDKDHNALFGGVTDALLKELDRWNGGKFKGFEFTTERHAKAWIEYLRQAGRVASPIRTVIYCELERPV